MVWPWCSALIAIAARDSLLRPRMTQLLRFATPLAAVTLAAVVYRSGTDSLTAHMVRYGYASVAILSCSLVFRVVEQSGTGAILARFMRLPWLVRLGRYSYGLYVWHVAFAAVLYGLRVSAERHLDFRGFIFRCR
jgi:peptidoglycan/LPS O-acetylase OafA/YrhL